METLMMLNSPLQWLRPLLRGQWHVRDKKKMTDHLNEVPFMDNSCVIISFLKPEAGLHGRKRRHISSNMCNYSEPDSLRGHTGPLSWAPVPKPLTGAGNVCFVFPTLFHDPGITKGCLHCCSLQSKRLEVGFNCSKVLVINTECHYLSHCVAKWICNFKKAVSKSDGSEAR